MEDGTTCYWFTSSQGIANGPRGARAHGNVIDDVALGTATAGLQSARICALVVDAGQVVGAIVADQTLRSTALIRIAEELGVARANPLVALCVWTAGRWVTRVLLYWLNVVD